MPFWAFVTVAGKSDMAFQPYQAPAAQRGADIAVPAGLEMDLTKRTGPDPATGIAKNKAVNPLIHTRPG